jgi:MFS family permease
MNENDRAITGFTMVAHLAFHAYELTLALFIVVWLDTFDVTPAVIGAIIGIAYGLVGVGAIVSGSLADTYGSRRLVLVSLVGMGAGFLFVSVATTIELVAVGLIAWGIGASLYHPAALSLLTRGTEARGTALGYHGAAGNVGTAVGPLVAAILLTFLHWRLVALVFVLPAAIGVLLGLRFDFDSTVSDDTDHESIVSNPMAFLRESRVLFTGGFVLAFAIMILHGVYARGVLSFLPEILADLPLFAPIEVLGKPFEPSQYVYAGLLFIGAFGQYAGGKLTDNHSVEGAIIASYAAIVVISLAFVPSTTMGVAPLVVVCALIGFAVYMTAPIRQALVAKYAAADVHGLSFGYTYLGVFGFGAVGTMLAGIVLTYGDTSTFFIVFGAVAGLTALIGGLLLLVWDRQTIV